MLKTKAKSQKEEERKKAIEAHNQRVREEVSARTQMFIDAALMHRRLSEEELSSTREAMMALDRDGEKFRRNK